MSENDQVTTFQNALEIARGFASHNGLNESRAEAFAEVWYEAGKAYDKASPNDLRVYLARRFQIG